jgi:hypothetical protein
MRAAGAKTAQILHLRPRDRDSFGGPTTLEFGGGGGVHPDAELLELGRQFDAAVAALERYDREITKPASRAFDAKVGPRPDGDDPEYHARWKAAYTTDLEPIERASETLLDLVRDLAARVTEFEPETLDGLAVMVRVLRREQSEMWRQGPGENPLVATVVDAAVRFARIEVPGAVSAATDQQRVRWLLNRARQALDEVEALGINDVPDDVPAVEPDPIFAAIEAHRAADAALLAAEEARDLEVPGADERLEAANAAEIAAFRNVLRTPATTEDGKIAKARYGCEMVDEGCVNAALRILFAMAALGDPAYPFPGKVSKLDTLGL